MTTHAANQRQKPNVDIRQSRSGERDLVIHVPSRAESQVPRPLRWTYVTRHLDPAGLRLDGRVPERPQAGDVVVGRVLHLGHHVRVENREGRKISLFPFDRLVGALANRYATDQFEGYARLRGDLADILGVGGVVGDVVSQDVRLLLEPTLLRIEAGVVDAAGKPVNLRNHPLPQNGDARRTRAQTVLVVGSAMNAGKSTAAAGLIAGLTTSRVRVGAAKITGTSSAQDLQLMEDAGALRVLDFTAAGWPSTFLCTEEQLLEIYRHLRSHLLAEAPDVIVLEIADGILQRETDLLLSSQEFRKTIDHVIFAAGDSLAAESGVRRLIQLGYPVLGVSGKMTTNVLQMQEAEAILKLPCLDLQMLCRGDTPDLQSLKRGPGVRR